MKIKVTSVYVDDRDKALRFYTHVGFAKKTDFSQGPYRWLMVASREEQDGTELQLALNNNPQPKRISRQYFNRASPRPCFSPTTSRATTNGTEFTMPPTDVTGSTIAMLKDTCGNLVQLTQMARHSR